MCSKKFKLFPMRNFPNPVLPVEVPDTEFKKKYPPDPELNQEMNDKARVWKVYRDEAIQHDDGMLRTWNHTIDTLLTFSGLFSAAVTAFVIESYQFLQPQSYDFGTAIYALSMNDTATLHSLSASSVQPSSTARIINGLWFTSLFLSLAAAFFCILVRQWLDEYVNRTRASSENPRHWSRRRAFYFHAIDTWGVAGIISILPVLLHAALFLFFAGMVVLLWSLSRAIATWLSALGGTLLLLYGTSLCLPFWNSACPFAMPFTNQVQRSWVSFCIYLLSGHGTRTLCAYVQQCLAILVHLRSAISCRTTCSSDTRQRTDDVDGRPPRTRHVAHSSSAPADNHSFVRLDLELSSSRTIQQLYGQLGRSWFDQAFSKATSEANKSYSEFPEPSLADHLDCDVLCWLILSVSDSDASATGFQALGAVTSCSPLANLLKERRIRHRSTRTDWSLAGTPHHGPTEAARVIRSALALWEPVSRKWEDRFLFGVLDVSDYWPDLLKGFPHAVSELLQGALYLPLVLSNLDNVAYRGFRDRCMRWTNEDSQSIELLHSTAVHLATMEGIHRNNALIYLCFCELGSISRAQWVHILPGLRADTPGLCPRHPDATSACDLRCFIDDFFVRMFSGDTTLDPIVLKKLLDRLCRSGLVPYNSPTWLSYVMSTAFLPRDNSGPTLEFLLGQLELSHNWHPSHRPDLGWLKLWRRIAHLATLRWRWTGVPLNLVTAMLWDTSATPPIPSLGVIQAVLYDGRRQSIWKMVGPTDIIEFFSLAEALAVALCSISRKETSATLTELTIRFCARMDMWDLMWPLNWQNRNAAEGCALWQTALHMFAHAIELRPDVWIIGVNRLKYDDDKGVVRPLAISITREVIQRGPCTTCLLPAPPETLAVWVHDVEGPRGAFLSRHASREAALEANKEEDENIDVDEYRYKYGDETVVDWKSDEEDENEA